MNKGERTREYILNRGMLQSSQYGLSDITIGSISKLCGLSRTGVISHFNNKDDMQVAILQYAGRQFEDKVIKPSAHEDPFTRLKNMLSLWIDWTMRVFPNELSSCPFVKAMVEYEHREDSIVRQYAFSEQEKLLSFMAHLIEKAQKQNKIIPNESSSNIAFDLYSLYVGGTVVSRLRPSKNVHSHLKSVVERALSRYEVHS